MTGCCPLVEDSRIVVERGDGGVGLLSSLEPPCMALSSVATSSVCLFGCRLPVADLSCCLVTTVCCSGTHVLCVVAGCHRRESVVGDGPPTRPFPVLLCLRGGERASLCWASSRLTAVRGLTRTIVGSQI